MAKRLIDANALPVHKAYCVDEAGWGANFYVVDKSDIDNAPTVNAVEEVYGKWIIGTGENALERGYRMCSVCGEIIKTQYSLFGMFNYCHYCGAEMDGGKNG
jgi:hypothetical protein